MVFRLVLKSVTLNDLELCNGHYFALFAEFGSTIGTLCSLHCGASCLKSRSGSVDTLGVL